jgi:hypothetical protein
MGIAKSGRPVYHGQGSFYDGAVTVRACCRVLSTGVGFFSLVMKLEIP